VGLDAPARHEGLYAEFSGDDCLCIEHPFLEDQWIFRWCSRTKAIATHLEFGGWVVRSIVTGRFGIVTAEFGNVTAGFGNVTRSFLKPV